MDRVMLLRLKHVHRFRDRHKTVRHYLRIPGRKAVALPGEPGSREFLAAYQAATQAPAPKPQATAGSLNALAASYYASPAFLDLRPSSQANYRRIIERLRNAHGPKPVALLNGAGVRKILADRAEHPAAANHLLRILRLLCQHAMDTGLLTTDPTVGVKRRDYEVQGYRPWTEADIAAFEARHATGTKPRRAMALLLYTGQRRSDVVRMGRQHIRQGRIHVRQVKTHRELQLPIHPALAAELAHVPPDHLHFLAREDGTPHSPGGFYNLFVAWCAEAGLPPGLAPHGLRKAAARRLAEAGATAHQIAAVTGHRSLHEVTVYTAAADQARLAEQAMGLVTKIPRTKAKRRGT
jgi:integrase